MWLPIQFYITKHFSSGWSCVPRQFLEETETCSFFRITLTTKTPHCNSPLYKVPKDANGSIGYTLLFFFLYVYESSEVMSWHASRWATDRVPEMANLRIFVASPSSSSRIPRLCHEVATIVSSSVHRIEEADVAITFWSCTRRVRGSNLLSFSFLVFLSLVMRIPRYEVFCSWPRSSTYKSLRNLFTMCNYPWSQSDPHNLRSWKK
jgi:hypothetical protein